MDFNGGMFNGDESKVELLSSPLVPTQHVQQLLHIAWHGRHAVIRCMHKINDVIMPALLVQLNGHVSTHPGYYSTKTTALLL